MTETSWPFTDQPTTDTEYSWLMREIGQGVIRASEGATSLEGSADSSGMVSYCEAGRAIVRGFMYRNSAQLELTHEASESNPRIDTVVIELNAAAIDPDPRALVKVIQGTAASSPIAETLVQTDTGIYQFPLYNVYIGGSATNIGPSDITNRRVWKPSLVGEWTTALRPLVPSPSQLGYNTTLTRWERWDGTTWVGLDAYTVGGRQLLDGTTDPTSGQGTDNSLYYKYQD